jgi:ligand-binding SRPBCC domain-containing protein
MAVHTLHRIQRLPTTLAEAWAFFAAPGNLPRLTPPWMGFELLSPLPDTMTPGLQARYRVRPFLRIPVTWVSEITEIDAPRRFVDVQRKGPYRAWRHEHRFREIAGGVEIEDQVQYELPLGPFGEVLHVYMVRPRLARVFEYRRRVLEELFGRLP